MGSSSSAARSSPTSSRDRGRGSPRPRSAPLAGRPRPPRPSRRSAIIRPPVASRFARIRAGSTSSPSSDSREPRHRRAGRAQQLAERPPLGVPRAGGALVLVRHRAEQRRGQAGRLLRAARARRSPRPGCACAASPTSRRPCASRTSATSVWESRTTSRATFATAPEVTAERGRELADAPAQRVPGQHRLGQPERVGVGLGHRGPGLAERGERAGRAAELGRQRARRAAR